MKQVEQLVFLSSKSESVPEFVLFSYLTLTKLCRSKFCSLIFCVNRLIHTLPGTVRCGRTKTSQIKSSGCFVQLFYWLKRKRKTNDARSWSFQMAFLSLLSVAAFIQHNRTRVFSMSEINLVSFVSNSAWLNICFRRGAMLGGGWRWRCVAVLRPGQRLGVPPSQDSPSRRLSLTPVAALGPSEEEGGCSPSVNISPAMINQLEPSCQIKPVYFGSQSLYNSLVLMKYSK